MPDRRHSSTLHRLAAAGVLMVITSIAYSRSLTGGFIIDDDALLTESRLIKASDGVYRFWCTTEPIDYWPVSNTTLWLEWRLWGVHSTGYRVTNLALHVIESLLIWAILQRLSIPGAFVAALLFALHPVNVESVAWIAQRKTILAMLFSLLSILWYLKSEAPLLQSRSSSPAADRWYWLAVVAFGLAMLSKVSVAVLPLLLLMIVGWLRSLTRRDLVRAIPFFFVATVLVGVNLWFRTHDAGIPAPTGALAERLLGAASALWFYLYKALLPVHLVFMYPAWHVQAERLHWWLPLFAFALVPCVLWRYRRSWGRPFLFAWGYFCVALSPALGLTEPLVLEDHYQHLALIGVIVLAAGGWDTWRRRAHQPVRTVLSVAAVIVAGAFAVLTWRHSALYADSVTLMQAALEENPQSARAHHNVGYALLKARRLAEAREHFEQALRIEPDYFDAHTNLGATLAQAGQVQDAVGHFRQALRLRPDNPYANDNLGAVLRQAGRPGEAIEYSQRALRLQPDSARAHSHLGRALLDLGRPAEAIEHFQEALRLDPDDREAQQNLERAVALKQAGDRDHVTLPGA